MNPMAMEFGMQVNYLEVMVDLPWETFTEDNFDEECPAGKQAVCLSDENRIGNLFWNTCIFSLSRLAKKTAKAE